MQGVHWIFGYGSLIWNPGFAFAVRRKAVLKGAHRSLCIYSHHYRGTPAQPGLVFGLKHGGSCLGMAFGVSDSDWPDVQCYLRGRELVSGVYREVMRPVLLDDGAIVSATVFLADQGHSQFAGTLSVHQQARLVRAGRGTSGANADYVISTAEHLSALGIVDKPLLALAELLRGPDRPAEG